MGPDASDERHYMPGPSLGHYLTAIPLIQRLSAEPMQDQEWFPMLKPGLASLSCLEIQTKLPFLCSTSLWHWSLLWVPSMHCLPLAIIFNQLVLTKFLCPSSLA